MPHAYTTKELHEVYEQIALERPHACDECETKNRLSHSHLAPKGHFENLATLKENIVYHCLDMGGIIGCHSKYESMQVAKMKNFEKYYRFLHGHSAETKKYFWSRCFKLMDYWMAHDMDVWRRIRALMAECDKVQHPNKVFLVDENGDRC